MIIKRYEYARRILGEIIKIFSNNQLKTKYLGWVQWGSISTEISMKGNFPLTPASQTSRSWLSITVIFLYLQLWVKTTRELKVLHHDRFRVSANEGYDLTRRYIFTLNSVEVDSNLLDLETKFESNSFFKQARRRAKRILLFHVPHDGQCHPYHPKR